MDPQQGVLVRNIPESAIKLTSDESLDAKFWNVKLINFQGLTTRFRIYSCSENVDISSVGEQFLSNVKQPLAKVGSNFALFDYLDSG